MVRMSAVHPEIVVCGTNLAFYSRAGGNKGGLLEELLGRIRDLPYSFRWRFSSIPPACLSIKNLNILKQDGKFCRHFHIPVQSASSKILKKMKRPYSLKFLEGRMQETSEVLENVVFSYDIMVGFPGETEEDFSMTLGFLKKYPPVRVHVFRYSDVRKAGLDSEKVSEKIKRRRMEEVKKVSGDLIDKKLADSVGKIKEVIPENNMTGYSEDYLPVSISGTRPSDVPVSVVVTSVKGKNLIAKPLDGSGFEKNVNMYY